MSDIQCIIALHIMKGEKHMDTTNRSRDSKGMLKLWRFLPNRLLTKVGRSFITRTHEAMKFSNRFSNRRQVV